MVPTLVGVPINPDIPVMGCKTYFVGEEARKIRGSLRLTRPIKDGIVHDWDAFEEVLCFHLYSLINFLSTPEISREILFLFLQLCYNTNYKKSIDFIC